MILAISSMIPWIPLNFLSPRIWSTIFKRVKGLYQDPASAHAMTRRIVMEYCTEYCRTRTHTVVCCWYEQYSTVREPKREKKKLRFQLQSGAKQILKQQTPMARTAGKVASGQQRYNHNFQALESSGSVFYFSSRLFPSVFRWFCMIFRAARAGRRVGPCEPYGMVCIDRASIIRIPQTVGALASSRTLLPKLLQGNLIYFTARCLPFRFACWSSRSCQRLLPQCR